MNRGFIKVILARLCCLLPHGRSTPSARPLWKLDDRELEDIGLTREQAREIDLRMASQRAPLARERPNVRPSGTAASGGTKLTWRSGG